MERPIVNVNVGGAIPSASQYVTKVLKGNIPFADQVNDTYTKYVIKWDFDLGGETVDIPSDCVLEFDGGTISNGTIAGNGCGLIAPPTQIISNAVLTGINVDSYDIRWFGAKEGQNIADTLDLFYRTYILNVGVPLKIIGHYKITRTVNVPAGIILWNGYASIIDRPQYNYPGSIDNHYGEIDVAKGVTAFKVSWEALPSVPKAYDALVSFRGINFYCSEIREEQGGNDFSWDNIPETCVLHYKIGGRPSFGFKFEDCIFNGFTRAINGNWAMGSYGSIMSGVLVDNCLFSHNNYGIYVNNEKETGTYGDLTVNNLDMIRCHFGTGSKCYLDGLYGTNKISLTTFQGIENPIFIHMKYGILFLEGLYLENDTGSIDIVGEFDYKRGYNDFQAIVHFDDFYHPIYNYGTSSRMDINFSYVTVEKLPNLYPRNSIHFKECAFSKAALEGRNYSGITLNSIDIVDTPIYDGETFVKNVPQGVFVVKENAFTEKPRFDLKGNNGAVVNLKSDFIAYYTFDRNAVASTISRNKNSRIKLAEIGNGITETYNQIIGWDGIANNVLIACSFYKTQDEFTLTFYDSEDNVINKAITPVIEGLCTIIMEARYYKQTAYITVSAKTVILAKHYISDICLYRIDSSYSINGSLSLIDIATRQLVTLSYPSESHSYNDGESGLCAVFRQNTGTRCIIPVWKYGSAFYNANGYTPAVNNGYSSERPTHLTASDIGFQFFDRTLKATIWWSGTDWREYDGAVAGVRRVGNSSQRPSGADIYKGFRYMQTNNAGTVIIFASNITTTGSGTELDPYVYTVTWVKADGTDPDATPEENA